MNGVEAIYKLLRDNAAIRDNVGPDRSDKDVRVFEGNLPADEVSASSKPAIVLELGVENRALIHRRASGRVEGFSTVNCLARTLLKATDLAGLVRDALNGFRGEVTSGENSLLIRSMVVESAEPIPIRPESGASESLVHGVRCDVRYAYREQVSVYTGIET